MMRSQKGVLVSIARVYHMAEKVGKGWFVI